MKFKYIFLTAALSLALVACKREPQYLGYEPDSENSGVVTKGGVKLSMDQSKATEESVTVDFNASYAGDYCPVILPKATLLSTSKQEDILVKVKDYFEKTPSMNLAEYVKAHTFKGNTSVTFKGLAENTGYAIVVYEVVNGELKGLPLNTETFFASTVKKFIPLSFEFRYGSDDEAKRQFVDIMPDDQERKYYVLSIPKSFYDRYSQQFSDEDILLGIFSDNLKSMLQPPVTEESVIEAVNNLLISGNKRLDYPNISAARQEVILAGAIELDDKFNIHVTSNISKYDLSLKAYTTEVELAEVNFNIEYQVTENFAVHFTITPPDDNIYYLYKIAEITPHNQDLDSLALAKAALEEYTSRNFPLQFASSRGVTNYSRDGITVVPDSDYYFVVLGVDLVNKTLATTPTLVKFHTPRGIEASELTFNNSIVSEGPHKATIQFSPSVNYITYAFALYPSGTKEKEELQQSFQQEIVEGYKGYSSVNPGRTMHDFLTFGYFNSETYYSFKGLEPETKYDLFTLSVSPKGEVVKVDKYADFLTTPALSNAAIEVESIKVFDGKDITEEQISGASNFRNAAVIFVKFKYNDSAVKGYGYMAPSVLGGADLDPVKTPDSFILEQLENSGNLHQFAVRKSMYVYYAANWNREQTLFYWGLDADDAEGAIQRKVLLTPRKADVRPNEELTTLIQEIEAAEN